VGWDSLGLGHVATTQRKQYVTWSFISTVTWSRGHTQKEQRHDVTSDPPLIAHSLVPVSGGRHFGSIQAGLYRTPNRSANAEQIGFPAYLVRRLHSVLNVAARLIYHVRSADHITDALASLHWLRVPEWIEYKVAVLTYKVLHGTAPRGTWVHSFLLSICPADGHYALLTTTRPLVPSVRLSSVANQPPGFHGRWTPCLEHSAGGHNYISVTLNLLSTLKTSKLGSSESHIRTSSSKPAVTV